MEWTLEELASRCDVDAGTVRRYERRGLLPDPRRRGRRALYGEEHRDRVARVRRLEGQGLNLAAVERLLAATPEAPDQELAAAVLAAPVGGRGDHEAPLDLGELAERSGAPVVLLEALERQGLLSPRELADGRGYTSADVALVRCGLALLEAGLPLAELLDLARRLDTAMRPAADEAVDLFVRFVRDPIRAAAPEPEAGERVVAAFERMLPAAADLVAHHFRRLLLASAEARVRDEASGAARRAARP